MMKPLFPILLLIIFLSSCQGMHVRRASHPITDTKIKRKVLALAEKYVRKETRENKRKYIGTGVFIMGNEKKRFILDTTRVVIGNLDEDSTRDAIFPLSYYEGQFPALTQNLIFLRKGRKFELARVVHSDMRILRLKDRVLSASVPTRPLGTPLHNCSSCRELVDYRFLHDSLVTIR